MRKWLALFFGVSLLAGCGDSDTCDPVCSAKSCMVCDTSTDTPRCVSACGDLACQDGTCVAPEAVLCDPPCGECRTCDTSGTAPTCIDNCAAGLVCNAGACEAPACDPPCDACQTCDTSGTTPTCTDNCSAGQVCNAGVCETPACDPPCGPCGVCDVTADPPACASTCGSTQVCDPDFGVCVRDSQHGHFDEIANATLTTGPEVTATCLTCHAQQGADILQTAHWRWWGSTPGMEDPSGTPVAEAGKKNLINNFCIAITSNEKRCAQCHAGYGYDSASFDFGDPNKIDCLICHADPAAGYSKEKKTGGLPPPAYNLAAAARSVGEPQRQNCGACHFKAGGGPNVKKGDLGPALGNPTEDVDVHMGRGMTCADCHRGPGHTMLGRGVHNPVDEGRVLCEDCHGGQPHAAVSTWGPLLDNHTLDIACQTCHIPAYSRVDPTKMDWDWSTAGNRTRQTPGELPGIVTDTLPDGTVVTVYDAMKGDFVWNKNVQPALAWYNGGARRMTTSDSFTSGMGTGVDPVQLAVPLPHPSAPSAAIADMTAKIFPFKLMRGRTPADTTSDFMIVPKLFGPGGFWAGIPDAANYDPATVEALWSAALTAGARAAGQVATDYTYGSAGTDWDWHSTVMYMGLNHEIAPAAAALQCTECHAVIDFTTLGYACDDPVAHDPGGTPPVDCGNRHY